MGSRLLRQLLLLSIVLVLISTGVRFADATANATAATTELQAQEGRAKVTPAQLDAAIAKLHTALKTPGKTPESVALDIARDLKSHRKANTSASKVEARSIHTAVIRSNNTVLIENFLKELFQVHKGPGFRVF